MLLIMKEQMISFWKYKDCGLLSLVVEECVSRWVFMFDGSHMTSS